MEKSLSLPAIFHNDHGPQDSHRGVDIVQEIEKILPDVINVRKNSYMDVRYDKLVPLLIQAIKDLSDKISDLEKESIYKINSQ